MKYVYILQSIDRPDENYVGLTDDLRKRLAKAVAFERYLKIGSGRAFARKRLR